MRLEDRRYFVRFNAGRPVNPDAPPPAGNILIIIGDIVACGFDDASENSAGWPVLMRVSYDGHIIVDAFGGRTLTESANTNGKRMAILASWASLGAVSHVALCLGSQDYGGSRATATDFGTTYAAMIDAIHARFPSAQVIAFTPIPRTGETTPNAAGNTLPEYRTAISNLKSSRAWLTVLAGPSAISEQDLERNDSRPKTRAQPLMSTALLAAIT